MCGFRLPAVLVKTALPQEACNMNSDTIQGKWKQITGKVKEKWGKLTDDDLTVAEGSRDYLAGKIQERYDITRDVAHEQVREFEKSL